MKRYRVVYSINEAWETQSVYTEAHNIAEAAEWALHTFSDKEIVRVELTGFVRA